MFLVMQCNMHSSSASFATQDHSNILHDDPYLCYTPVAKVIQK